jgi:outer membrane protein, multidrug efflux system
MKIRMLTGALMFFAGACTVGPDYRPPEPEVPDRWSAQVDFASTNSSDSSSEWWRGFHDEALDLLMERAAASNLDLQIAEARITEARALRAIAEASFWPNLNGTASYRRIRTSEKGPLGQVVGGGLTPLETGLFNAALDASWEIDVFGGTRRSVEAAEAVIESTEEARRDLKITLLAEIGLNYIELRGLQKELAVTASNLAAQQQTLALTKDRLEAGLATELDTARAEAQAANTASEIPLLEAGIKRAIHRLGVLVGETPGALAESLGKPAAIPNSPPEVPVGLPSEILRRRPDIRRSERELAAATARIGIAVADLFPRFFLTGSAGLESLSASDFFTGGSRFWSAGPTIQWPIFNAGRIRQNIEVQNARQEKALLAYEQTVLAALEEVENALVGYSRILARYSKVASAERANRRAVELAHDRYRSGLVDFLDVLDAERSLYDVQARLTRTEKTLSQNLVRLYKALGGGWTIESAEDLAVR